MLRIITILGLLLLLLSACNRSTVFDDYVEIGSGQWHKDSLAFFQFEIEDTASTYNFDINVRNIGNYPFSNLFLFVDVIAPNDSIFRDTVEYTLAQADGKWLGKGIGDLFDNTWQFKSNLKLELPGLYTVKFQQAMRKDPLNGIRDVGFRVEKAQE